MSAMAFQITSLTIVYSAVYSGAELEKPSKLRITGLCEGNSPVTDEFPAHRVSNAETVSICWRHHEMHDSDKNIQYSRCSPTLKCECLLRTMFYNVSTFCDRHALELFKSNIALCCCIILIWTMFLIYHCVRLGVICFYSGNVDRKHQQQL